MTPEDLAEVRERLETAYWHEPFPLPSAIADTRRLLAEVNRLNVLLEEVGAEKIER